MKKALSVFIVIFSLVFLMCACSQSDLAELTSGEGDGYATLIWGDKTYLPYGALSAYSERGKQIGIVDGDKDDRVYKLKGYSSDEWLVNSFSHDPAMLLREESVTDIPDGWQSEYEWNK